MKPKAEKIYKRWSLVVAQSVVWAALVGILALGCKGPADEELKAEALEAAISRLRWEIGEAVTWNKFEIVRSDGEKLVLRVRVHPGGIYEDFKGETYTIAFGKIEPVSALQTGPFGTYLELVESAQGGIIMEAGTREAQFVPLGRQGPPWRSKLYQAATPARLKLYYTYDRAEIITKVMPALMDKINQRIRESR